MIMVRARFTGEMGMSESNFRDDLKNHADDLRQHARQGVKRVRAPFYRVVFSRTFLAGVSFILQLLMIYYITIRLGKTYSILIELQSFIIGALIIWIINSRSESTYKLAWSLLVAVFPLMGTILYVMAHFNFREHRNFNRINHNIRVLEPYAVTAEPVRTAVLGEPRAFRKLAGYVEKWGGFPSYTNTEVKYYSLGDYAFEDILEALESAEEFIFMEFFIIQPGIFWDNILSILERKVEEGVEVRVLYDGVGCLSTLPYRYNRILEKKGILSHAFSPITPFFSTHYNNRDHRKIIIVDGKTAFSGGFNLADEYLNIYERFGKWKDNAFRLQGDAVRNYTLMFFHMWNLDADMDSAAGYRQYMEVENYRRPDPERDGIVIPYGDGPNNANHVAKNVYIDLITGAVRHVHIMTPYLIPDTDTLHALKHAARSGVEVNIIIPHIPDKKVIYLMSKSYVRELIESGVNIYEYEPGFVHTKMVVVDDRIGATGTVNMDFRSFYLHYECGSIFYDNEAVLDMERDFASTLEVCQAITHADILRWNVFYRLVAAVFRVFSPLV